MAFHLLPALITFSGPASAVTTHRLDGSSWSLSNANHSLILNGTVTVPSTVPDALHRGGLAFADDPHFGYTQNEVLDLMTADNFTYTLVFGYVATKGAHVDLVLLGVDTAAVVTLNGVTLGRTNNMHTPFSFDARAALAAARSRTHTLVVSITSATAYAQSVAAAAQPPDPQCTKKTRNYWPQKFEHGTACATYVRKWTGSFGWDCTRAFVAQGLYKSVELRSYPVARLNLLAPIVRSKRKKGAVLRDGDNAFDVEVRAFITVAAPVTPCHFIVAGTWPGAPAPVKTIGSLQPGGSSLDEQTNIVLTKITATNVPLWWTHDSGNETQPIYTVSVRIVDPATGATIDAMNTTVAFRTFEWVGSVGNESLNERWPLFFRLNGNPLFSKGFNWMPVDVLLVHSTPVGEAQGDAKRARIADVKALGGNSLRIWGGGVYEDDAFYDATDAAGILVMQDGSFFGKYTDDPTFLAVVTREVKHIARRLARHPSLAVWSGNNESPIYGNLPFFLGAQLSVVQEENPNVVIMPSCPSLGWISLKPTLVPRPSNATKTAPHDKHYYGSCGTIDEGNQFQSEFGWPSAPLLDAYAKAAPADELTLLAPFKSWRSTIKNVLWTREAQPWPGSTLVTQFPVLIPGAATNASESNTTAALERWLFLTQALQSLCIGASVTKLRQKPDVMGSLIWSINQVWTAPAWSAIQHDGQLKPLAYHAKRLFSPLLLSFIGSGNPGAIRTTIAPPRTNAKNCSWIPDVDFNAGGAGSLGCTHATSKEMCCAACAANPLCFAATFSYRKSPATEKRCAVGGSGEKCCWLKTQAQVTGGPSPMSGALVCVPSDRPTPPSTNSSVSIHLDSHLHVATSLRCAVEVHRWDASAADPLVLLPSWNASVGNLSGAVVHTVDLDEMWKLAKPTPCASSADCFLSVECNDAIRTRSSSLSPPARAVYFPTTIAASAARLEPKISAVVTCVAKTENRAASMAVKLTTDAAAPHVFVSMMGGKKMAGRFDDNDVLLLPGRATVLTFTPAKADSAALPRCSAMTAAVKVYAVTKSTPVLVE